MDKDGDRPLLGPAGRLERGADQRDRAEWLRGRGGGAGGEFAGRRFRFGLGRQLERPGEDLALSIALDHSADAGPGVLRRRTTVVTASADLQGTLRPDHQVVYFLDGNRKQATGLSTELHGTRTRHVLPAREHPRPERRAGDLEPADHLPRPRSPRSIRRRARRRQSRRNRPSRLRSRRQSPPATSRRPAGRSRAMAPDSAAILDLLATAILVVDARSQVVLAQRRGGGPAGDEPGGGARPRAPVAAGGWRGDRGAARRAAARATSRSRMRGLRPLARGAQRRALPGGRDADAARGRAAGRRAGRDRGHDAAVRA